MTKTEILSEQSQLLLEVEILTKKFTQNKRKTKCKKIKIIS